MRQLLLILFIALILGTVVPAEAQLRSDVPTRAPASSIVEESGSSFTLNRLFSPEHFRMGHSYEMAFGSFGGQGMSTGTYTNSLRWHFNQRLAARVDVAFSHSPFGSDNFSQNFGQQAGGGNVYLRNAEVAYRPSENTVIHLSFRQSPYGSYMSPYGHYSPYRGYGSSFGYGGGSSFSAGFGSNSGGGLFWNSELR